MIQTVCQERDTWEVPADRPVSDGEEFTVSVLPVFTEEGAPLGPAVKDRIVWMDNNVLALMNI